MSKLGEHKRVTLTTISTQRSIFNNNDAGFSSAPPSFSRFGDFLDTDAAQSNKSSKTGKSVRLQLELFETDSNRYPEFNYSKLLYLEKKKAKMMKTKTNNGNNDPFADNDDDVERIAKELEAKYGNSYARGRGRRKKDDFCDIGMGYDESDSFIDNTEAYDEILPEEIETLEGGFYINCGALEFKNLNKKSSTRRTDAIIKMPERSRKRVISSSSDETSESSSDSDSENNRNAAGKLVKNNKNNNEEDDGDDDDDDDDEDDDDDSDSESGSDSDSESNTDSESLDGSDSDSKSLGDGDSGTSVNTNAKSNMKQNAFKRSKLTASVKQKANSAITKPSSKLNIISSSSSNSPRPNTIEISDSEERQSQAQALKKVVKTTTVKDMLKAKRDSFLKSQGQVDGPVKSTMNGEVKCVASTNVESNSDTDDSDSVSEQGKSEKTTKIKDGNDNLRTADTILPATLDKDIMISINSFKESVKSRDLCGKRFILDNKLKSLILKIYEALLCTDRNERNMVFAHLEYQLQLPKYFILRKAKALRAREEKNKTTNALEKLRKAVAEVMPKAIANYEIELHKFAELAAADVNAEHPPKMPRKKFQWNNDLRELLYEVYQARWTSYAVLGKRKDSLEQFINGYLKDKVVDVWAVGWMRYEELQREIDRHKSASKKLKDKPKKSLPLTAASIVTVASPTIGPTEAASPGLNNYPKQLDELTVTAQSRSCANSDTDSATSASSSSLKRKLDLPATGAALTQLKPTAKPPKIKFHKQLAATLAQMSQSNHLVQAQAQPQPIPVDIELMQLPALNNYLKQFDDLTATAISHTRANSDTDASSQNLKRKLEAPAPGTGALMQLQAGVKPPKKKYQKRTISPQPLVKMDNVLSQPSTSAQAAALNAAAVAAAASMLELASPIKQTNHSIFNIISTSAINAPEVTVNAPINNNNQPVNVLHSTTSPVGARPVPCVINLDDYKSPSDILQTSHQLATSKWQPVQTNQPQQTVAAIVTRLDSSSESDGVEFVSVYPATTKQINSAATKPRSKTSQKSKPTAVINKAPTAAPNGINGTLGFNLDNMYIYNNNASTKLGTGVIRATATSGTTNSLAYNPQILKKLSDLSALEKQMKWSQCSLLTGNLKAGTATGTGGSATGGTAAATGAGTTTQQ